MTLTSLVDGLNGYMPALLLVFAAAVLLLWQRFQLPMDSREPPLLRPTIPIFGHIIGLLTYQASYWTRVAAQSSLPIFTVSLFNSKSYIVASPGLVQSALRSKDLDFEPFIIEFAQRMGDLGPDPMKMIRETDLMKEFHKEIHAALTPGPKLDETNHHVLERIAHHLNAIENEFEAKSFYLWIRQAWTEATTTALFGSHSPFLADASLCDDLWDFETDIIFLIMNLMPSLLAPKAYKGRARVSKALAKYYEAEYDREPDVGLLVKNRATLLRKYRFTADDLGRAEIAIPFVSTSNALPTLFWLLVHIFEDEQLVEDIRNEVRKVVITTNRTDGSRETTVDFTKIGPACPSLIAAYQEGQRLYGNQIGNRFVIEDTLLTDGDVSYLLKKGATAFLPSGPLHSSAAIWGPSPDKFDVHRFLKTDSAKSLSEEEKEVAKSQKKSFLPFGGGKHLCPGRRFAYAEIIGTVAVLALAYDITAPNGDRLRVSTTDQFQKMSDGVAKPVGKNFSMGARIRRRDEFKNVSFRFVLPGGT